MCSIVAIIEPSSDIRVLFLENRDRPLDPYLGSDFRILARRRVVALYDHRSQGVVSGYSLSSGVYGGVTNVPGYSGPLSRGVVLKRALTEADGLEEALTIVLSEVGSGMYSSANYVLGDGSQLVRVESHGSEYKVIRRVLSLATTNHFRWLLTKIDRRAPSRTREAYLEEVIGGGKAKSLGALVSLASHHDGPRSICRHGLTMASFCFALPKVSDIPIFMGRIGYPCAGLAELQLDKLPVYE